MGILIITDIDHSVFTAILEVAAVLTSYPSSSLSLSNKAAMRFSIICIIIFIVVYNTQVGVTRKGTKKHDCVIFLLFI